MSFTKLDYCQYLLSSPINYTVTNLADHLEGISHDLISRYLRSEKLTPRLLWDNVKPLLQVSENAYVFDDTVWNKRHATGIDLTRTEFVVTIVFGYNHDYNYGEKMIDALPETGIGVWIEDLLA